MVESGRSRPHADHHYFKAPMTAHRALDPEHDIFIQQSKLKNTLREWMGKEPVTHSEA